VAPRFPKDPKRLPYFSLDSKGYFSHFNRVSFCEGFCSAASRRPHQRTCLHKTTMIKIITQAL
jgi:hypothetical protein